MTAAKPEQDLEGLRAKIEGHAVQIRRKLLIEVNDNPVPRLIASTPNEVRAEVDAIMRLVQAEMRAARLRHSPKILVSSTPILDGRIKLVLLLMYSTIYPQAK